MNNTTLGIDLKQLQDMNLKLKKLQQMQKMREQITAYLEDVETIWTYAPLIIVAFGLVGKH